MTTKKWQDKSIIFLTNDFRRTQPSKALFWQAGCVVLRLTSSCLPVFPLAILQGEVFSVTISTFIFLKLAVKLLVNGHKFKVCDGIH